MKSSTEAEVRRSHASWNARSHRRVRERNYETGASLLSSTNDLRHNAHKLRSRKKRAAHAPARCIPERRQHSRNHFYFLSTNTSSHIRKNINIHCPRIDACASCARTTTGSAPANPKYPVTTCDGTATAAIGSQHRAGKVRSELLSDQEQC